MPTASPAPACSTRKKAYQRDPRIPQDREARLTLLRRGLIPWLAGIDPETGSPRRRVARLADIPSEAAPLIELLVEQRLLATDRMTLREGDSERKEITIEPAHEALLRQWGLLRGWLEEDFAALTTLEGVKRAARDWAANGRREDWLNHTGARLEDAEKIVAREDLAGDLSADARDYLRQCREREQAIERERLDRLKRERAEQERQLRDAQVLAAANRRIARRTGIGLAAALVLAALAGWQWWMAQTQTRLAEHASQDAKAQRDRAERTLTLATETANGLILNLAQKFKDVAGVPAAVVENILAGAIKLQDQLISGGEISPELRWNQADGLNEAANTLLSLGDTDAAVAAAQKSHSIMQGLLAAEPGNAAWQATLAVSDHQLGEAFLTQNRLDEAMAAFRESLAVLQQLLARDSNNTSWQLDLALNYERIGFVQRQQGNLDQALVSYREGLAILKALVAKDTKRTDWQLNLSLFDNFIGEVLQDKGRLDEALSSYQESLGICRMLVGMDASNTLWQRALAFVLEKIGTVLYSQNKLDDALAVFRESVSILTALIAGDQTNARWKRDLSIVYLNIGYVLSDQGNLDEALAAYRQSVGLLKELVDKDKNNYFWQLDLPYIYANIAGVLAKQNKVEEALVAYRESDAILERLLAVDAGNVKLQQKRFRTKQDIGDLLRGQSKFDEAQAHYLDALAIMKGLVAKDPINDQWPTNLGELAYRLLFVRGFTEALEASDLDLHRIR
jgi:tetratricopeptide (TPR) repeat protein